jgi:hypothetical protein
MSDRKLDEITLAIFGDHDAGFGETYSELDGDDFADDPKSYESDWADFNFGDPAKRKPK